MQLGCCLTAGSFVPQVGAAAQDGRVTALRESLQVLHACGYDFAELTAGLLADLDEPTFADLAQAVAAAGVPVRAVNSFIPPALPLVGPEVDLPRVRDYVERVMARVAALGGECIVFGSGRARSIPDGFPHERAWHQLRAFLSLCDQLAGRYGLVVAVEPLNRGETNVIFTVSEAIRLVRDGDWAHIRVLADLYHMHLEREAFSVLDGVQDLLVHVHVANAERRAPGLPVAEDVDVPGFFRQLRAIGYDGTVAIECRFDDFAAEVGQAAAYLRSAWAQAVDGR
ncbi:hypothetical protein GCM10010885_07180 [Alicyclobacillus cellulosilyticus]|uniref:Xylose isomerase-like TIM barrel domain-containing protein n=1 Tax=Alicyclobacillus cellulosilyticus TaxID=1003997 RepID=A0A917K703_9BACL|nr:sugar phosphate isomerase/epimerase family protein [Alicyclobacillus cellulosilyticus]GGJ00509.1 hypothetical protein GCM10010885_07180 [Alicyclobacillus cellulosilyticus]